MFIAWNKDLMKKYALGLVWLLALISDCTQLPKTTFKLNWKRYLDLTLCLHWCYRTIQLATAWSKGTDRESGCGGRSIYKKVGSNYGESPAYPTFLFPCCIVFIWRGGREIDVSKMMSWCCPGVQNNEDPIKYVIPEGINSFVRGRGCRGIGYHRVPGVLRF